MFSYLARKKTVCIILHFLVYFFIFVKCMFCTKEAVQYFTSLTYTPDTTYRYTWSHQHSTWGFLKLLITMLLFYLCHLVHFKRDFLLILISCILEYVRSCCILSIRPMMRLFFLSILHEIGSLANSWRVRV